MQDALRAVGLHLRTARHVVSRGPLSLRRILAAPDERLVFVFGCPRSGTTFLARSIGSAPGFVDLGEVAALKAAIPRLAGEPTERSAPEIRRILALTGRLGLAGGLRGVEQTPETVHVAGAALAAFPRAHAVHIVRDGRDVVASLLARGWLNAARDGTDDAGIAYGATPRFWVEPERREEFLTASDARRCAWAWRRYVSAGLALGDRTVQLRYEEVAADPLAAGTLLGTTLGTPAPPIAAALAGVHDRSIGRHRTTLDRRALDDVEGECGQLLAHLGYV